MSFERPVVFALLGMPVTTTVLATSGMVLVLCVLAIVAGRRIRRDARPLAGRRANGA